MSHYYELLENGDVIPQHFVEMTTKPGFSRPTRITDVRKWQKAGRNIYVSVTTVQSLLDKPALTAWKIDQHLKQAFDLRKSKFSDNALPEYLKEVKLITQEELDKPKDAGTDFHELMQAFVEKKEMDEKDYALCESVFEHIVEQTGCMEWIAESNFVRDGYAGQIDLNSDEWMIDLKSKDSADKMKKKLIYDDHLIQLGAYRGKSGKRAANVFVCLDNGQVEFIEHDAKDLDIGYEVFKALLTAWKLLKSW